MIAASEVFSWSELFQACTWNSTQPAKLYMFCGIPSKVNVAPLLLTTAVPTAISPLFVFAFSGIVLLYPSKYAAALDSGHETVI